jgi:deoxyribodipyrimidine photo-lyase
MRLHWHRRDLRLADNLGLADAPGEPVGVFVFDESVLAHAGAPRVAFVLDALASLRAAYRDRGSEFVVRHGDSATVLVDLADTHDADVVSWNRDYSGLARRRDDRVANALDDAGVTPQRFHDAICHPPGSITTNAGDPYQVYTYFWKKWRDREKDDPRPVPTLGSIEAMDDEALPTIEALGFEPPSASIPPASTAAARDRLEEFLDGDVYDYADRRDYPADDCTSRLSPHLKFGTIGVREVDEAVRSVRDDVAGTDRESVVEFRSQLAWREFYAHVLNYNPEVVTENYADFENEIEWADDPEHLAAWKRGETGYPIVDAGMRQLREEADMHNRVRMIVASFLTKDLLCDWRHGYAHFREHLVDHDTANDNGGWQWAASTGTDAQPYFRIFNPTTQGERYDPDAEYIAEYVPELRGVEPEVVHGWHACSPTQRRNAAPEYPDPIVDHAERRERALEIFERARGEAE